MSDHASAEAEARVEQQAEEKPPVRMPTELKKDKEEPEVNKLFRMVMKYEGSDLHLKVGQPPMMRLRGVIRRMDMRPLTQEDMERLFYPVMKDYYKETLKNDGGADFAHIV